MSARRTAKSVSASAAPRARLRALDLGEIHARGGRSAGRPSPEDVLEDAGRPAPGDVVEEPEGAGRAEDFARRRDDAVLAVGLEAAGPGDPGLDPEVLAVAGVAAHLEAAAEENPAVALLHEAKDAPARFIAVARSRLLDDVQERDRGEFAPVVHLAIAEPEFPAVSILFHTVFDTFKRRKLQ